MGEMDVLHKKNPKGLRKPLGLGGETAVSGFPGWGWAQ